MFLRFAGKTDYNVTCHAAVGKIAAQKLHRLVKPRGVVLAVHGLERCIAAGLQ